MPPPAHPTLLCATSSLSRVPRTRCITHSGSTKYLSSPAKVWWLVPKGETPIARDSVVFVVPNEPHRFITRGRKLCALSALFR